MAEDKQDVENVEAKEAPAKAEPKVEKRETKAAIQINLSFATIVMICAIATIVIAFLAQFIWIVGGGATFVTVCRCFEYIALCATVILYLVDYLKNKNIAINATLIFVILAIIVSAFV